MSTATQDKDGEDEIESWYVDGRTLHFKLKGDDEYRTRPLEPDMSIATAEAAWLHACPPGKHRRIYSPAEDPMRRIREEHPLPPPLEELV